MNIFSSLLKPSVVLILEGKGGGGGGHKCTLHVSFLLSHTLQRRDKTLPTFDCFFKTSGYMCNL